MLECFCLTVADINGSFLHLTTAQILMNPQEARTLQLCEMVVWTPDGMMGEVIIKDGSGVRIHWKDGQCGYYQFSDLLSQIERLP
jgi:hypothetical protein